MLPIGKANQTTKTMIAQFAALLVLQLLLLASSGVNSSILAGSGEHLKSASNEIAPDESTKQISIRMPDIRPDHGEQYLCMSRRLKPNSQGEFIVAFNPAANASRVHHMLVYGCQMPGIYQRDSPNFVWDCSHMVSSLEAQEVSFEQAPVCRGKQQILFSWALDAPALKLPPDVGFKIGANTDINFLVLQVHYGHYHAFVQSPDLTDNSGLILDVKPNAESSGITRRAGVLLLMSTGFVIEGKSKHEIWCEIEDDIEIHPFRFRVHTHKLGTKVTGAKIGKKQINDLGLDFNVESIIGVGDPQQPQTFYPVRDANQTLSKGDSVYAACEFNNNQSHIVMIGNTAADEMCNFYMMYWTESPDLLSNANCYGRNPEPSYFNLLSTYLKRALQ